MPRTFISLFLSLSGFILLEAQESFPITFNHVDKTVFGTFTTPEGSGPFPTIIIAPGSGPNDRDGTIHLVGGNSACLYPNLNGATLTPYKDLADALVDSGYAVLRYDKLEFTYTSNIGTISFEKLWLPVESAIDYLKTRMDVDTNNLILLGHSEGSALIPYIARDRNDIKALISVAGARTPFDSLLAFQLVEFARICDGDTAAAKTTADQILGYFEVARTNDCNLIPSFAGVSGCVWRDYFEATDPVSAHYNQAQLPTLFLGLGQDLNVPLSELLRFQSEVTITDDFWSIPGLNHYMTPENDPDVSMVLTDTIVYWLRQHTMISGTSDLVREAELLSIFPNPTNGILGFHSATLPPSGRYRLNTVLGTTVATGNYETFHGKGSLNLTYLPTGIYILEIATRDRIYSGRVFRN